MEVDKRLSSRVDRLSESKTLKMSRLSRELREQGVDVISLSLGEPDFRTPEHIRDAAKKAIDDGYSYYPPVGGYLDLKQAIADKYANEYGYSVAPSQVVVSNGAKQTLANLILSLIDFDDDVLIPAPYWVTYPEQVNLAGGKFRTVLASVDQDYKITPEQLDEALRPETRMLMFSSPSNPTGSVYSKEELLALGEVMKKYPNLIVVSDEIYEFINFEGKHHSISMVKELHDRLVIVNGVSKGYAMTGWRIGYLLAPDWIAKSCEKMQGQLTSAPASISQRAALAAIESSKEAAVAMCNTFKERRDYLLGEFASVDGFKMNKPDGAFYLFIDISGLYGKSANGETINSSEDFAMYLLKEARVSLVAGDAFGAPDCIRISYAASDEDLQNASARIKKAVAQLK